MRLGDQRAIRPLVECLDHAESPRLQVAALRALAGLGGVGVLDRLLPIAEDASRDDWVRQAAREEAERLSPVKRSEVNPLVYWALGILLIAAALVSAATVGPIAAVPLFAGAALALFARIWATRGMRGGDAGDLIVGGDWGGGGDGGGSDGGGGS